MKVGNRRCQCADCKEYFNSVAAFEKHRRGDHGKGRYCDTSDMEKNAEGYWVTALNSMFHVEQAG